MALGEAGGICLVGTDEILLDGSGGHGGWMEWDYWELCNVVGGLSVPRVRIEKEGRVERHASLVIYLLLDRPTCTHTSRGCVDISELLGSTLPRHHGASSSRLKAPLKHDLEQI